VANPLFYFFIGMLACFLGTIPFGPINLLVVKTTVDMDRVRGLQVASAASIVEMGHAFIAICFGIVISNFLDSNLYIKAALATVFIILAIIVFFRKPDPSLKAHQAESESYFKKGLIIALFNPQAIPFWIFALATINQYFSFEYIGAYLISFLAGILVGKFFALYGFVVASGYLKAHLQKSSILVNRLLASILLFIGLSQIWKIISV